MSLQRNHYEVLGIAPSATTDQIKKKYRELARKFHPDIIQDKVLGQRVFTQINQAYRVLADPERRAQYNSQLAALSAPAPGTGNGSKGTSAPLAPSPARPAATSQARPVSSSPKPSSSNPSSSNQAAPAAPAPRVPPQTARPQSGSAAQPRPAAPQGQPGTAQKSQAITLQLTNADNAIMAGKPVEARAFCVKALEIDPPQRACFGNYGGCPGPDGTARGSGGSVSERAPNRAKQLDPSQVKPIGAGAASDAHEPSKWRGRQAKRRTARAVSGAQMTQGVLSDNQKRRRPQPPALFCAAIRQRTRRENPSIRGRMRIEINSVVSLSQRRSPAFAFKNREMAEGE